MPIYCYQCSSCEGAFNKFHPMAEKIVACDLCGAPTARKVPAGFSISTSVSPLEDAKAGDLVKRHIEEAREEVKKEKQEMMREKE